MVLNYLPFLLTSLLFHNDKMHVTTQILLAVQRYCVNCDYIHSD